MAYLKVKKYDGVCEFRRRHPAGFDSTRTNICWFEFSTVLWPSQHRIAIHTNTRTSSTSANSSFFHLKQQLNRRPCGEFTEYHHGEEEMASFFKPTTYHTQRMCVLVVVVRLQEHGKGIIDTRLTE